MATKTKTRKPKKDINKTHQYVAGESPELANLFDRETEMGRANESTLGHIKGSVENMLDTLKGSVDNMLYTLDDLISHFGHNTTIAQIEDLEELDW